MHESTATAWPPPPDLAAIKPLVAAADIEGSIAGGAPQDEYDTEAELLFDYIEDLPAQELKTAELLPILESVWRRNFDLDDEALQRRRPALLKLAQQIERSFGPAAQPAAQPASQSGVR